MTQSTFILATIGGAVSLIATSLGAALGLMTRKVPFLQEMRASIDFALGVMLSAVVFSMVGPELIHSLSSLTRFISVTGGVITGIVFVGVLHKMLLTKKSHDIQNATRISLATAIILHNLPEGVASGASVAGMPWRDALPLQVALVIQNIPEGMIITMCLLSFGWTTTNSCLGGIFSGFVEFTGAIIAGLALSQSMTYLPIMLATAGGAMLMAVALEIKEARQERRKIQLKQLTFGFFLLPTLNLLFSL